MPTQSIDTVRELGRAHLREGNIDEFARLMLYCRRRVRRAARVWLHVSNPFHAGHADSTEDLLRNLQYALGEVDLAQEKREEFRSRIEELRADASRIWDAIDGMVAVLVYIRDEKDGATLKVGAKHVIGRVGCTMTRARGCAKAAEERVREIQQWWPRWCALLRDAETTTRINVEGYWAADGEGRQMHRHFAATVRSVARHTASFRRWVEVTADMEQDFDEWHQRGSAG